MQKGGSKKQVYKPQHQRRPGSEASMQPRPVFDYPELKGTNKLLNQVDLVTGGDSDIGKAVSILFPKEGALFNM